MTPQFSPELVRLFETYTGHPQSLAAKLAGLTTREVKERVKSIGTPREHRAESQLAPELKEMQETLSAALGAPVEIHRGANTGKITIVFYSEEELENILRRLKQEKLDKSDELAYSSVHGQQTKATKDFASSNRSFLRS